MSDVCSWSHHDAVPIGGERLDKTRIFAHSRIFSFIIYSPHIAASQSYVSVHPPMHIKCPIYIQMLILHSVQAMLSQHKRAKTADFSEIWIQLHFPFSPHHYRALGWIKTLWTKNRSQQRRCTWRYKFPPSGRLIIEVNWLDVCVLTLFSSLKCSGVWLIGSAAVHFPLTGEQIPVCMCMCACACVLRCWRCD